MGCNGNVSLWKCMLLWCNTLDIDRHLNSPLVLNVAWMRVGWTTWTIQLCLPVTHRVAYMVCFEETGTVGLGAHLWPLWVTQGCSCATDADRAYAVQFPPDEVKASKTGESHIQWAHKVATQSMSCSSFLSMPHAKSDSQNSQAVKYLLLKIFEQPSSPSLQWFQLH